MCIKVQLWQHRRPYIYVIWEFADLGGSSEAIQKDLIGWGKLHIKPSFVLTCSSPCIFHIPQFHLPSQLCVCMFFHVCVHTVDTYISSCLRCSFSSFIFCNSTLECFSSSVSTALTHPRTHTHMKWHNDNAVKFTKACLHIGAIQTWLKARLVPRGCYNMI